MALTQHTAPTIYPFDNAEDFGEFARRYLNVYDTTNDDLIESLIKAATDKVQGELRRSLYTQKWRLTLDAFPASREIKLEYPPVSAIDSLKYYDSTNSLITMSSSMYTLDPYSSPGRLVLNYQESWPATYNRPNAVEIIFTAGYGGTDELIPQDILQAIKFLTAHFYLHREPSTSGQAPITEIPLTLEWLLAPNRVYP